MTYDPQEHHRRSIRLPGHDYRLTGWYFITLVSQGRECVFDQPTFRAVAETLWTQLPQHFPHLVLDEWVLMPNHLHAIVVLLDGDLTTPVAGNGATAGSLGAIIGNYKSTTTRRLNAVRKQGGRQLWQRNYYEHIIRSNAELEAVRRYIRDNPGNWALDNEHPQS